MNCAWTNTVAPLYSYFKMLEIKYIYILSKYLNVAFNIHLFAIYTSYLALPFYMTHDY